MSSRQVPLILTLAAVVVLIGAQTFQSVDAQDNSLVCLEHHPPGNPDNVNYSWVTQEDANNHMANHEGDTVVPDEECPVPSPTPTATGTSTATPTMTQSPTVTETPTITNTPTITATATETAVPTATGTVTSTATMSPTVTATPVPICHRIGNPNNPRGFRLIYVSGEDVQGHLDHGDQLYTGQCTEGGVGPNR
jgi:hypothetical protein